MKTDNNYIPDKQIESKARYRLTHFWTPVYLGSIALCGVLVCVLMDKDEQRFLWAGLSLFALMLVLTIAYLAAFSIIRNKDTAKPDIRAGVHNPAGILPSKQKYMDIRKRTSKGTLEKGRWDAVRYFIGDLLTNGQIQPAVVISVKPFIVAAYDGQMDGTVLLSFPDWLAEKYSLSDGDRLITVNCYYKNAFAHHGSQKDIFPGTLQAGDWEDICPVVPLFFSEQEEVVKEKCFRIDGETWNRAEERIRKHCEDYPGFTRDGFWFAKASPDDWNRHVLKEANFI